MMGRLTGAVLVVSIPGDGSNEVDAGKSCHEALETVSLATLWAVWPVPVGVAKGDAIRDTMTSLDMHTSSPHTIVPLLTNRVPWHIQQTSGFGNILIRGYISFDRIHWFPRPHFSKCGRLSVQCVCVMCVCYPKECILVATCEGEDRLLVL